MPETTVASNRWRVETQQFKARCDNTLQLNNSIGLSGTPMKLNRAGVCAQSCGICITPFPRSVKANCFCSEVPLYYEIDLPSQILGTSNFSSCFALSGRPVKFASNVGNKNCLWSTPGFPVPVCHTPKVGGGFGCGAASSNVQQILKLVPISVTQSRMEVNLQAVWGNPKLGEYLLVITWVYSTTVTSCFGEWSLPFVSVTPAYGNYSPGNFSWPGTVRVRSLQLR